MYFRWGKCKIYPNRLKICPISHWQMFTIMFFMEPRIVITDCDWASYWRYHETRTVYIVTDVSEHITLVINFINVDQCTLCMGGATGGVGGQCPPTLGPAGYRGYGGRRSNENDLCFYSRQSYCTSDWISTPLSVVDTGQVNDIWKDGLGRVSIQPH